MALLSSWARMFDLPQVCHDREETSHLYLQIVSQPFIANQYPRCNDVLRPRLQLEEVGTARMGRIIFRSESLNTFQSLAAASLTCPTHPLSYFPLNAYVARSVQRHESS